MEVDSSALAAAPASTAVDHESDASDGDGDADDMDTENQATTTTTATTAAMAVVRKDKAPQSHPLYLDETVQTCVDALTNFCSQRVVSVCCH